MHSVFWVVLLAQTDRQSGGKTWPRWRQETLINGSRRRCKTSMFFDAYFWAQCHGHDVSLAAAVRRTWRRTKDVFSWYRPWYRPVVGRWDAISDPSHAHGAARPPARREFADIVFVEHIWRRVAARSAVWFLKKSPLNSVAQKKRGVVQREPKKVVPRYLTKCWPIFN